MKKLVWIFCAALTSCELIIDVDVPYDGDKIVINGLQRTTNRWTVDVSHSLYVLDNDFRYGFPTQPADVTIFDESDGSSIKLVADTLGLYIHNSYPQEGHKYRIVAKSNGLPDVEAVMVVPRSIKMKDVKWDSSDVNQNGNQYYSNVRVDITFDDPAEEKNYYAIRLAQHFTVTYQRPIDPAPRTDSITQYYDAVIDDPAISTEDDGKRRFSDETFNGTTYTAPIEIGFYGSPGYKVYRVDLELITISEEYFRYEESRELYNEVDGDPFAQPVQIYTNITNGFGVFAGTSTDLRTYKRNP